MLRERETALEKAPEVVLSPFFGILLSSVIVGNTHGQLAEIDFRQGEWTMGCLRRGQRESQVTTESPILVSVTFFGFKF